jgi:F0F1-type ATP synthase assembly protein I
VAAASSALYHYAAAVAVVVGIRLHRPADPWPWYLIGTALLAFATGDAIQLTRPVPTCPTCVSWPPTWP